MIIISNIFKRAFSQVNALSRYLNPIQLKVKEATEIPTLHLKSEKYLIQHWWS